MRYGETRSFAFSQPVSPELRLVAPPSVGFSHDRHKPPHDAEKSALEGGQCTAVNTTRAKFGAPQGRAEVAALHSDPETKVEAKSAIKNQAI